MKKNYTQRASVGRKILNFLLAVFFLGALSSKAQLLIPQTGSVSLPCGTNTVITDNGGPNGNYTNGNNGWVVLYAGANGVITITGSYSVEVSFDYIYIYAGEGITAPLVATLNQNPGVYSYTSQPGQAVTVRFTTDGSVVYGGFSFSVTYSGNCNWPACTTPPAQNTIVPTTTLVCPVFGTSSMSLSTGYSLSAISYSWMMSTQGALGPYVPVPSGGTGTTQSTNLIAYTTPTLAGTTWYQAVLTCTNGGNSTTIAPVQINVAPVTINTVPYNEGFEGIVNNKDLPNCSWTRNDNYQAGSRTAMVSAWRQARTGNKFAEFDASNAVYNQTRYFYSNGIILNAGITYSASVWCATPGYASWNNVALLYGPNQTPTGLITLATIQSPNQTTYSSLSNTFQVATTNTYYCAVRATEGGNGTQLVWDDLQIIAPCQFTNNAANIALSGTTNICQGQTVTIGATGAQTYSWSNNSNAPSISVAPFITTTYSVIGINPLSGCTGTAFKTINVNQLPPVQILAFESSVCEGESINLLASGANSYTWSEGPSFTPLLNVTPTQGNNSYTVVGVNAIGCSATAVQVIAINPAPVITVTGNTMICEGATANLTAAGAGPAGQYQWMANTLFLQSNPVAIMPNVTTTYTISGVNNNDCEGSTVITVAVDPCLGLKDNTASTNGVSVFPNPNNGVFTVVTANGLNKTIQVIDVTGRVVLSSTTSSNAVELNISALSNGVYYVKVISDAATEVVKVVKH